MLNSWVQRRSSTVIPNAETILHNVFLLTTLGMKKTVGRGRCPTPLIIWRWCWNVICIWVFETAISDRSRAVLCNVRSLPIGLWSSYSLASQMLSTPVKSETVRNYPLSEHFSLAVNRDRIVCSKCNAGLLCIATKSYLSGCRIHGRYCSGCLLGWCRVQNQRQSNTVECLELVAAIAQMALI